MLPFILAAGLFAVQSAPVKTPESPQQRPIGAQIEWKAFEVIRAARPDKQGLITVRMPVSSAFEESAEFHHKSHWLVLQDPEPQVTMEEVFKRPELRDRLSIRIAPDVVAKLKKQGITDVAEHFKNHTVKARGKAESTIYLCFPAVEDTTIIVARVEDIQVAD